MVVLRVLLALACAAVGSVCVLSCLIVRFEEGGDLERFQWNAVFAGALCALAVLLYGVTFVEGSANRWVLLGVAALAVWAAVAVPLDLHHEREFQRIMELQPAP